MPTVTYPDVTVHLSTGQDGNAYGLIAAVRKAIRRKGGPDEADEFSKRARACASYDDLLTFINATVNVT